MFFLVHQSVVLCKNPFNAMTRKDLVIIKNYLGELIMVLYCCFLVAIQFVVVETWGLKPKIIVENMKTCRGQF